HRTKPIAETKIILTGENFRCWFIIIVFYSSSFLIRRSNKNRNTPNTIKMVTSTRTTTYIFPELRRPVAISISPWAKTLMLAMRRNTAVAIFFMIIRLLDNVSFVFRQAYAITSRTYPGAESYPTDSCGIKHRTHLIVHIQIAERSVATASRV